MKKIIFDLDNTLLFLSDGWKKAYQEFINKYNLNVSPEELFSCIGLFEKENSDIIVDRKMICDYVNERLNTCINEDMFRNLDKLYQNVDLLNVSIINDLLDYLSKKYELFVYSNWFTDVQLYRLKRYNLDKFFTKIYGFDILPVKPSKNGIKKIVGNDNISNYIFIGDSISIDIEIPFNMGMNTIFYNRKHIIQDKYKEVLDILELKNML